jgi:hypothetical protein
MSLCALSRNTIRTMASESYVYEFVLFDVCKMIINLISMFHLLFISKISDDNILTNVHMIIDNNIDASELTTIVTGTMMSYEYYNAVAPLRETYIYKMAIVHSLISIFNLFICYVMKP